MDREEFIKEMKKAYRLEPGVYKKILDASMKSRNWTEQSMIIMEELAELSQQVSKGARGEHDPYDLILEMADVVACLDMLMAHYKITEDEIDRALAVKSVYIGKKLGLVNGAKDTTQSLNDAIAKHWGTIALEAPCNTKQTIKDLKFNVGDEVITVDGTKGRIVDICKCSECEKRGFYEIYWKTDDGDDDYYITVYEAQNGFKGYHKIGIYWFNELEKKEPVFEYPSEEAMVKQIRIFCASHNLCADCPLASVFCRGHNNNLSYRLMYENISAKDVRLIYDAVIASKQA